MDEKNTNLSIENETSKKKKSGCLKGCLTPIVIFIIIAGLIGSCFDDESADDGNNNEEAAVTKDNEPSNEEIIEDSEATAEEIEFYKNELGPELDKIQNEYDRIWNDLWIKTFNGISDGTVDVYKAYKNMTFVETNYDVLSDNIAKINNDNLSKENNKLLTDYISKFKKAADYRALAADQAAKMFDNGDFKPSEFEEIKGIVSLSDSEMLSAIVNRVSIESNLGLIESNE